MLATRPEEVTRVLAIVYRAISGRLIQQAGLARASAATGAVTLIQRFGSALNLNVHFHILVPDGVYCRDAADERPRFVPVSAPGTDELTALVRTIAERVGRSLERAGLLTRDLENAYLAFDPTEEAPINGLIGHSITYPVATGPREGQKVFTLQALPPKARLCDRYRAMLSVRRQAQGHCEHRGTSHHRSDSGELFDGVLESRFQLSVDRRGSA